LVQTLRTPERDVARRQALTIPWASVNGLARSECAHDETLVVLSQRRSEQDFIGLRQTFNGALFAQV
jgi:hypothetical protein